MKIAPRRALERRLVLVGEGRDRKGGADENQLLEGLQELDADFVFVGDRVDGRATLAAREVSRRKRLGQEDRAGLGGDAPGELQRLTLEGEVAQHQAGFLAVREHPGGVRDRLGGDVWPP